MAQNEVSDFILSEPNTCITICIRLLLVTLTSGVSSRIREKTHAQEYEMGDDQEGKLVSFLDHTSHLTIVVWKLATGYSEIVSGNICFGWVRSNETNECLQDEGRYQYNIEEKDVKFGQEATKLCRVLKVLYEYVQECDADFCDERTLVPLFRAPRGKQLILLFR